jgi:hypothetical protein
MANKGGFSFNIGKGKPANPSPQGITINTKRQKLNIHDVEEEPETKKVEVKSKLSRVRNAMSFI